MTIPEHIRRRVQQSEKVDVGVVEQQNYIKNALADIFNLTIREPAAQLAKIG